MEVEGRKLKPKGHRNWVEEDGDTTVLMTLRQKF